MTAALAPVARTVATKVPGVAGKAAGANAKLASPKAAKAAKAAGGKPAAGARTASPGARAGGTTAAQQRAQIDKIKAARTSGPVSKAAGVPEPKAEAPTAEAPAASSSSGSSASGRGWTGGAADVGGAGGGFVLGVVGWVVTMTYLKHGSDGVKRLLRAKFLNQVTP